MEDEDASAYLRLSQFLELESHWLSAGSRDELCERICRTATHLLGGASVAIGLNTVGNRFEIVASDGDSLDGGLLGAAHMTQTPQLKSRGDDCLGAFPFSIGDGTCGCLHVRIDRPLFRNIEVSFLRFLASLTGFVIRTWVARQAENGVVAHRNGSAAEPGDAEPFTEGAARRYVAMAVHDLRNPLNVIAGYAALLDEESLGALTAQQKEAVAAIKRQARVLLSSVDQLIELDRLQAPSQPLASRFEVGELFDDLRSTCFAHCAERVRWPDSQTAAFDFRCDRRRLFSVAQNLIDNALKHTQDGEILVECARADGNLVLRVRDEGPGLDPELREKLVMHARSGTEVAPRSGLGLYMLASHVHALGGFVEIAPEREGGTNIIVTIPGCSETAESNGSHHTGH